MRVAGIMHYQGYGPSESGFRSQLKRGTSWSLTRELPDLVPRKGIQVKANEQKG